MRRIVMVLSVVLFGHRVAAQDHDHSMLEMVSKSVAVQDEGKYPPPDSLAKARLEKSPRHGEYTDVKLEGSSTLIRIWVSYPERKDKAPVVIVIHEIFGYPTGSEAWPINWRRMVTSQSRRI